jgi:hypothetical protein
MTDVLDQIGEQLSRAAQRQVARHATATRQRRIGALVTLADHAVRSHKRWRSPRPLAVVLALALGMAGAAYGAARLIGIGAPAPSSRDPSVNLIVTTRTDLLSVRARDPDGGPAWAFELSFERHTPLLAGVPGVCVAIGRIVDGRLGYLGQDGAFGDDGKFHAASVASGQYGGLFTGIAGLFEGPDTCMGAARNGSMPTIAGLAGEFSSGTLVANGLAGCSLAAPSPPAPRKHGHLREIPLTPANERLRRLGLERQLSALGTQLAVLRAGGGRANQLARRAGVTIAVLRRVDASELPLVRRELASNTVLVPTVTSCEPGAVRTYWQGFAGASARSITLVAGRTRYREDLRSDQQGAYLFVLAGTARTERGAYTIVTCRNGRRYTHRTAC